MTSLHAGTGLFVRADLGWFDTAEDVTIQIEEVGAITISGVYASFPVIKNGRVKLIPATARVNPIWWPE